MIAILAGSCRLCSRQVLCLLGVSRHAWQATAEQPINIMIMSRPSCNRTFKNSRTGFCAGCPIHGTPGAPSGDDSAGRPSAGTTAGGLRAGGADSAPLPGAGPRSSARPTPQDLVAAAAKKRAEEALAAQKRAEEVEAARKALAAQKRAETRARRSAAEKKAEAERAVAPDDGTLLDGGDEVSLDEPTN